MNQIVPVEFHSRLPMPRELVAKDDIDARKWRVLCETTFPNARSSESILMAIDYCRARGLDPFKKPVHIVPMWNSTLGREVETVWPGINEVQITAARTGAWAGMDEPKWGPDIERIFKGRVKDKQTKGWKDVEEAVTFPEWCIVTVHRMVGGAPRAFAEQVYWLEAYSRVGFGSELPTSMWIKRPRGQLHKVAKAASLRAAFPEEGEYTAEEMEGKEIDAGGVVINDEPVRKSSAAAKRDGDWEKFQHDLSDVKSAVGLESLRADYRANVFPTWNKDWQARFEEECEEKLAEFSQGDELEQTLNDSIEIEAAANGKADFVRNCHVIIDEFEDEKTLLDWWNSKEQKAARREHLTTDEVRDMMARTMARRAELVVK